MRYGDGGDRSGGRKGGDRGGGEVRLAVAATMGVMVSESAMLWVVLLGALVATLGYGRVLRGTILRLAWPRCHQQTTT